ncbi:outer membrane lipoprotein-sorting protein [Paludisphaera sp.]|uniref:outer membrane lipoprotein-sorting protein n=1 Tax=Paludisphaera sp. TaxID=2017432 RepID=UPI00301BF70D
MRRWGAMIGLGGLLGALTFGGAPASGQAQAPAAAQPPARAQAAADIDVETLLKRWEGQSTKLKTLDVTIFRTDRVPSFDEIEYFEGRALFKNPNLAFIDFRKIKQDPQGKPLKKDDGSWDSIHDERIQCTGSEVWQYRSDTRQIFIFPLEKDQAEKAIEEGPLPFLFNMKAEEAKDRYEMKMLAPPDASSYAVAITPKLDVDRESFSRASVQLDRSFMLPVRILLVSPDGKSTKDFKMESVKPNVAVDGKNFVGQEFEKWKVVRNPTGETPGARQPPAQAQPAGEARRPAPANAPRSAAAPAARR